MKVSVAALAALALALVSVGAQPMDMDIDGPDSQAPKASPHDRKSAPSSLLADPAVPLAAGSHGAQTFEGFPSLRSDFPARSFSSFMPHGHRPASPSATWHPAIDAAPMESDGESPQPPRGFRPAHSHNAPAYLITFSGSSTDGHDLRAGRARARLYPQGPPQGGPIRMRMGLTRTSRKSSDALAEDSQGAGDQQAKEQLPARPRLARTIGGRISDKELEEARGDGERRDKNDQPPFMRKRSLSLGSNGQPDLLAGKPRGIWRRRTERHGNSDDRDPDLGRNQDLPDNDAPIRHGGAVRRTRDRRLTVAPGTPVQHEGGRGLVRSPAHRDLAELERQHSFQERERET